MGLSSSQARLLNLTTRMHQIEYKAAKLEAQKLQMANESKKVYQEYQNALERTKIQYKSLRSDGSTTFFDLSLSALENFGTAYQGETSSKVFLLQNVETNEIYVTTYYANAHGISADGIVQNPGTWEDYLSTYGSGIEKVPTYADDTWRITSVTPAENEIATIPVYNENGDLVEKGTYTIPSKEAIIKSLQDLLVWACTTNEAEEEDPSASKPNGYDSISAFVNKWWDRDIVTVAFLNYYVNKYSKTGVPGTAPYPGLTPKEFVRSYILRGGLLDGGYPNAGWTENGVLVSGTNFNIVTDNGNTSSATYVKYKIGEDYDTNDPIYKDLYDQWQAQKDLYDSNTVFKIIDEPLASSKDFLNNLLTTNQVILLDEELWSSNKEGAETSVATNTLFQEVDDDRELRKAEAKYEADMRKIDYKDRKYDYDLAALEAERNAIKNEMETLKTVAKDNVERTFKLFG